MLTKIGEVVLLVFFILVSTSISDAQAQDNQLKKIIQQNANTTLVFNQCHKKVNCVLVLTKFVNLDTKFLNRVHALIKTGVIRPGKVRCWDVVKNFHYFMPVSILRAYLYNRATKDEAFRAQSAFVENSFVLWKEC